MTKFFDLLILRHCTRLLIALACASLLITCTAHAATPQTPAPTPQARDIAAIGQLEQDLLKALQTHDSAALDRILADDYVNISTHGEFTGKPDALMAAPTPDDIQQTIQDLRVRTYGDTAIATGVNVIVSRRQGWTAEVAFTDVFVREKGTWRAVSSHETLRPQGPTSPP